MAYTPINWQTGDIITAEKLNKMDRGWGYESTQLFSETVTTAGDGIYEAELAYSQLITADTIKVTFDGTEYVCPSIGEGEYGALWSDELNAYDFSEFPFNLYTQSVVSAYLVTQTAGEHTVAVSAPTLQTSADFDKAVSSNSNLPFFISIGTTTWQEAHDAMAAGRMAYTYDPMSNRLCLAVYATSNTATNTYTITCMTIFSSSSFGTPTLSAQSPTDPLTN